MHTVTDQGTSLSEIERAYLAGIIDGEGTIGIYRGATSSDYLLRLIVTNTFFPMLEWIHARIGGSLVPSGAETDRHKQVWQVVLFQARAGSVIQSCQPHLIVKSAQADLAMRFMADFVSFRGRGRPSEEQVAVRRWYYEQSLTLNERGGKGLRKNHA